MKWFVLLCVVAAVAVAGLQVFLRFWPADLERAHRLPTMPDPGEGLWVISTGARVAVQVDQPPDEILRRADEVIRATPRTRRLAGSVEDGLLTYVTRSAFWGFPDVTTIAAAPVGDGSRVLIRGRQRYGGYDWNVNRNRITGWLGKLGIAVPPDRSDSP